MDIDELISILEGESANEVEQVVAVFIDASKHKESYLVKWKGWPINCCTFEPRYINLLFMC